MFSNRDYTNHDLKAAEKTPFPAGTTLLRTNNVVDAAKHRDQLTKDEGASEWENPDAARVSGNPAAKDLPRAGAEGGDGC